MSIKWLLNIFKRKHDSYVNISNCKNETQSIPEIKKNFIEITSKENYTIIDIKEDCNITEYVTEMNRLNMQSLELTNNSLFNGTWDIIKKKKIYIISDNQKEYIIYSNDIKTHITEKIKNMTEDGHIDERVIEIDNQGFYRISRLKHSKSLSTYYVKSFSSKNPEQEYFKLHKQEAIELVKEILSNLNEISNIDNIINLQKIYQNLELEEKIKETKMKEWMDIYKEVYTLKDEERIRNGWKIREVPGRLESVAEHCFAMTNLAILINLQYNLNLNMEKVLTMINIHEYGEVYVGDITPFDGVSKEEKYQKELLAITNLMKDNPGSQIIIDLWKEFEAKETNEAIFVFLLDKFQSVLQSREYSNKYQMPELYDEFISWYKDMLKNNEKRVPQFTRILTP